jgi:hypothetical protein
MASKASEPTFVFSKAKHKTVVIAIPTKAMRVAYRQKFETLMVSLVCRCR